MLPAIHHRLRAAATAPALVVVLLLLLLLPADAFRFDLGPTQERCFTEEIPAGTDVRISYAETEAYGVFLDVVLTRVESGEVLWHSIGKHAGSFTAELSEGGDYRVCLTSRVAASGGLTGRSGSNGVRSVMLNFLTGSTTVDYRALATREHLRPMEIQLRQLEEDMRGIDAAYRYYEGREAAMRRTNEHMTALVMWIAIGVIAIFAVVSYLQYLHLRSYFRKKRLID